jgi:hypothetical protein
MRPEQGSRRFRLISTDAKALAGAGIYPGFRPCPDPGGQVNPAIV